MSLELDLRYVYGPEFMPLLAQYLGAEGGTRILEVGCGSAFLARLLARELDGVRVLALDVDNNMLDLAQQMLDQASVSRCIELAQGDVFRLPFRDGVFDHVTSHRLLCTTKDAAQALREQVRVTRPGGMVSAVACFCRTDGLPHFHGRYPLPGNHLIDQLRHKLQQVIRRAVWPQVPGPEYGGFTQDLLWQFKAAGLVNLRINGHLSLVSPGDSRIPVEEAAAYALARHEITWQWLGNIREKYSAELDSSGFSLAEFEQLMELTRARDEYLRADPVRVRKVMEVYTDALLIVRGEKLLLPGPKSS